MVQNFIAKIQNSDEATKKFWLVALSGLSMLVVISGWTIYIDKTVANVDTPAKEQIVQKGAEAPGFFAIFGAGVKTIFDAAKNKLSVSNNIVIENTERNFMAEGVESVKATKLP